MKLTLEELAEVAKDATKTKHKRPICGRKEAIMREYLSCRSIKSTARAMGISVYAVWSVVSLFRMVAEYTVNYSHDTEPCGAAGIWRKGCLWQKTVGSIRQCECCSRSGT